MDKTPRFVLLELPKCPTPLIDKIRSNQCQHEPDCFRELGPCALSQPKIEFVIYS